MQWMCASERMVVDDELNGAVASEIVSIGVCWELSISEIGFQEKWIVVVGAERRVVHEEKILWKVSISCHSMDFERTENLLT